MIISLLAYITNPDAQQSSYDLESGAQIQYKGVCLPVLEIPLWR